MFNLKHKLPKLLIITTIFSALLLLVLPVAAATLLPSRVFADHENCIGDAGCIQRKIDAANVVCFNNNAGQNDIIARCVEEVTAHYKFAGDPRAAPPLPSTAATSPNVVDSAKCRVPKGENLNEGNCQIVKWINVAIRVLSVLVGIVVTGMIIYGGIRYTAAGSDPNAVAAAKKQIFGAIFALVAYGLMIALLNYLVPGGVL